MVRPPVYDHLLLLSRGRTFHFAAAPPAGLRLNVSERDPRIVVNAILANAMEGDFNHFGRLIDLLREHDDGVVWGDCAALLAYAAPYSVLHELLETFFAELHGEDVVTQQWISEILCKSGALWSVPEVLRIFRRNRQREHYFATPTYLSRLLEIEREQIAEGPLLLPRSDDLPEWFAPSDEYDDDAFEAHVMQHYIKLCGEVSDPARTCVWEGEPLSLTRVAQKARTRIEAGEDIEEIAIARAWLEAGTGEDLSGWYRDHLLANLAAEASLEHMLASSTLQRFESGARYFFGRRIPD